MKTLQIEVHLLSKPHDNLNISFKWSTLQFHPQTQKIKKRNADASFYTETEQIDSKGQNRLT